MSTQPQQPTPYAPVASAPQYPAGYGQPQGYVAGQPEGQGLDYAQLPPQQLAAQYNNQQQPPAQYQPYPQQHGQPQHGQQHYAPGQQQQGQLVHVPVYQPNVGPCAAGGGHSIQEEFTACGLACGILLFPIGLICCLSMKNRTCMRCGMKFD